MQIDYEKELNKEQLEAVKTTEGYVLILAVAGSGKTRTLIYRVAYLIEQGVVPESILLLTFTNKAAEEMKNRAEKMLDERCSRITACTYHSFCCLMLRKYAKYVGLGNNFTILIGSDLVEVINIIKSELKIKYRKFPNANQIVSLISAAVNWQWPLAKVIEAQDARISMWKKEILEIADRFASYKKEHNMLDFDEMLVFFQKLLKEHPNIAKKISDAYRYIMVDEYQDSNNLQEEIVLELRKYGNTNLAVVGDDLQSLYAFRGANVENIVNFPKKVENCKSIVLNRNYRSNQEILDFSNCVVEKHAKRDNEELRCMYVALTRAKNHLTVLVPQFARSWSGDTYRVHKSHFLVGTDAFCRKLFVRPDGTVLDRTRPKTAVCAL